MDLRSLKSGLWQGLGGILGKMRVRFDKALTKNQGKSDLDCTESEDTHRTQGHFGNRQIPALSAPFKPRVGTADHEPSFGNDGEEGADPAGLGGGGQAGRAVGRVSNAPHCPIKSVNNLINLGRIII